MELSENEFQTGKGEEVWVGVCARACALHGLVASQQEGKGDGSSSGWAGY